MRVRHFFDSSLGRDFWNFRLGQLASLLGDSCGRIALVWWILEKTGSAAALATVLTPAMIIQLVLMPLFGPLGDRYSRKNLVVLADCWRFLSSATLASMVFFDFFNLPVLIAVFSFSSIGSALFSSVSGAIVPQLVSREKIQAASQQTTAINSIAGILGGILGGVVVSTIGIFGAFAIDTLSFVVATLCSFLIKVETKPDRGGIELPAASHPLLQWRNELFDGFKVLYRIPVLFWICAVLMLINLAVSPLAVVLPVLAKEAREMPAWFLGALESSIALGTFAGAMSLGAIQKRFRPDRLFMASIALVGIGLCLLPWVPNALLPLIVLLWIGAAGCWGNILLGTQIALTVPDQYRARLGSIMGFMVSGISPLGVAGASTMIALLGLNNSLLFIGAALVLLTPLLSLIPLLKEFLSVTPQNAAGFFRHHYSDRFASAPAESVLQDS